MPPHVRYDLYAIFDSNSTGRQTEFITSGTTQTLTTPSTFATVTVKSPSIYCEFVGLTPSANNQITISVKGNGGEGDVNGFQLIPLTVPTGAVSLPNTTIAATAGCVLDFSGYGPANTLGGLGLGGNLTVQDVASSGSVQFGGDVVASANVAVGLAAGAGSIPALVLAGSGNVQNITAANGAALTLPALAISAGTVNVGNATGYNGSVVLGGATALTGLTSPTVNVIAGALQVGSTLASTVAGANVQVNSGGILAGGPAGAIQVPVSINSGGVLQPDASQASTALIGGAPGTPGRLTIGASGVFQWVYSGSGAEGTLALGSATLNLPAGGSPIFRPQFLTRARAGAYVMTWSSQPANTPAWTFDNSLVSAGNAATWGSSGASTWDSGASWNYPSYTAQPSITSPTAWNCRI